MGSGASSSQVEAIKINRNKRFVNKEKTNQITQKTASKGQNSERISTHQAVLSRKRSTASDNAECDTVLAAGSPSSALRESNSTSKHESTVQLLEARVKELEKELGESESEKLDLSDQSERLEERIAELITSSAVYIATEGTQAVTGLQETLKAKDQYINQLEQELVMMKKEANKTRMNLKKRIKVLASQLNVAKQESSIAQMELRQQFQNHFVSDQGEGVGEYSSAGTATTDSIGSRHKVILELSSRVSEQAERIAQLEKDLQERDEEILTLRSEFCAANLQKQNVCCRQDGSEAAILSLHTALSSKQPELCHVTPVESSEDLYYADLDKSLAMSAPGKTSNKLLHASSSVLVSSKQARRALSSKSRKSGDVNGIQRQTTTLSDSDDSDWEIDKSAPSAKTHSAPSRGYVKDRTSFTDCPERVKNNVELHSTQEAWKPFHHAVEKSLLTTDVTTFVV